MKPFTLCLIALGVPVAQAAFDDPLYTYTPIYKLPDPPPHPPPPPIPPPSGSFEGPCGVAVNQEGNFYLSDYYHRVVDLFSPGHEYITQLSGLDHLDGPCGLATDGKGNLYLNDYHRSVARFTTEPFDAGAVIDGAPLNEAHPTGVAVDPASDDVYVDERDRIAVFDSSGARLGEIGAGTIQDGYGLAYSKGRLYVPDAGTETIKVYEAKLGETDPIAAIDGSKTPNAHFTSLRDAAIAVDDQTGETYIADTVAPQYAELAETVIWVFEADGSYEGRLKFSVEGALPVGLAVDNSPEFSQGRVYVTSGNTDKASLYAYRPGSATQNAVPLPPGSSGSGAGSGLAGGGGLTASPQAAAPAIAPASALAAPTKRVRHHKPKRHRRAHPNAGHR